ncbi:MAG: DNA-formamidopyrimidine glycosylase [Synechococcus sp.]
MPELPEVETVRRGLTDRLSTFQIKNVEILRDRTIASPGDSLRFIEGIQGAWIGQWHRRGKYLFAELHSDAKERQKPDRGHWGVHLRMTGQFLWLEESTDPCRHTRVRFWDLEGHELRFIDMRSFGKMWWVPPNVPVDAVISGLKKLGPEPFNAEFNGAYLQQRLKNSKRSIKAALLDQSLVAGTGNIYADESLFEAGIAPQTPAGQLKRAQLDQLCTCLVRVLDNSIGAGGTTFSDFRDLEGVNGNYGGQALVYRRTGAPCLKCGTPIERDKLAGRSTHWCPRCQH